MNEQSFKTCLFTDVQKHVIFTTIHIYNYWVRFLLLFCFSEWLGNSYFCNLHIWLSLQAVSVSTIILILVFNVELKLESLFWEG